MKDYLDKLDQVIDRNETKLDNLHDKIFDLVNRLDANPEKAIKYYDDILSVYKEIKNECGYYGTEGHVYFSDFVERDFVEAIKEREHFIKVELPEYQKEYEEKVKRKKMMQDVGKEIVALVKKGDFLLNEFRESCELDEGEFFEVVRGLEKKEKIKRRNRKDGVTITFIKTS